jgi:hypothetical protein
MGRHGHVPMLCPCLPIGHGHVPMPGHGHVPMLFLKKAWALFEAWARDGQGMGTDGHFF